MRAPVGAIAVRRHGRAAGSAPARGWNRRLGWNRVESGASLASGADVDAGAEVESDAGRGSGAAETPTRPSSLRAAGSLTVRSPSKASDVRRRRGWDSNPRNGLSRSGAFKAPALV